jgi:UDP-N-acetylmuramoyl-tripeptide--D-alanyl-D-alanine ligase
MAGTGAIKARDVAEAAGASLIAARIPDGATFARASIDSRDTESGDLFFAVPGERQDGHDFVDRAMGAGAAGAVIERPVEAPEGIALFHVSDSIEGLQKLAAWWRRRHEVNVVAVTGSVGKTTCKELTAAVLGTKYRTLKSEANLNTEIGIPLTLLQLTDQHERAVLEFGMYARGDIELLSRVALPRVGVVTNIGPVHFERLGSQGAITAAKAELVEALPPDGVAVLNGDDARTAALATRTDARVVYYGQSAQCDVRASDVGGRGLDGVEFALTAKGESVDVRVPLPGKHHVYPALAAAAVAVEEGFPLKDVVQALAEARPELRSRVLPGPNGSTILDDSYNASPASMTAALDLLAELPGRRIALLGDMLELGAAEEDGHRRVGERAATACDLLLVLGERTRPLAEAAKERGAEVRCPASSGAAVDILKQELRDGDHVLIKASRAMAFEEVVLALAER